MSSNQSLAGRRIDQFSIGELIARGGMAEVYLAEQRGLDRQVAVKIMLPVYAQYPDLVKRFEREARAAARLAHPNIIQVHATGRADGRPYLAMEYCPDAADRWLRRLQKAGRLPTATEAFNLIRPVSEALQVAHRAGIIHRDIKPSNILIRKDGSPALTDLGIAAVRTETSLTRGGTLLGTPQYMSPEQAAGRKVDRRTDIYALGIVLYELLNGRRPFEAEDSFAILYQQINQDPAPLKTLRPGLSSRAYQVVEKCLKKKPGDRYQTAAELTQAIDQVLIAEGAGRPRGRPASKAGQTQSRSIGLLAYTLPGGIPLVLPFILLFLAAFFITLMLRVDEPPETPTLVPMEPAEEPEMPEVAETVAISTPTPNATVVITTTLTVEAMLILTRTVAETVPSLPGVEYRGCVAPGAILWLDRLYQDDDALCDITHEAWPDDPDAFLLTNPRQPPSVLTLNGFLEGGGYDCGFNDMIKVRSITDPELVGWVLAANTWALEGSEETCE